MALKLVTAPATEPVLISEAREWVRQTGTHHDSMLLRIVAAASGAYEADTGQQLITAEYQLELDRFPSGCEAWDGQRWVRAAVSEIRLPRPPVQLPITSIKYLDVDGVEQTLATTVYEVATNGVLATEGLIRLKRDQSWPEIDARADAVRIRFKAGYGDDESFVPGDAKIAILAHVEHIYGAPGATVEEKIAANPLTFDALKQVRRVMRA